MREGAKYVKIVEWSESDQCFIGSCPELFYGGSHGDNEFEVFRELCEIIEETIQLYREEGKPLPAPMTGKDLVTQLQNIT